MKSLDFYFQKIALIVLIILMALSLFNEVFMFVWLGMLAFGVYHVIHYLLYLTCKIAAKQKIGKYMYIYLGMVINYFIAWYQFHDQLPEPYSWHLFGIVALLIGSYYFFNVHTKNLNPNSRNY